MAHGEEGSSTAHGEEGPVQWSLAHGPWPMAKRVIMGKAGTFSRSFRGQFRYFLRSLKCLIEIWGIIWSVAYQRLPEFPSSKPPVWKVVSCINNRLINRLMIH